MSFHPTSRILCSCQGGDPLFYTPQVSLWKGALAGQFHRMLGLCKTQTVSRATDRSRIYSPETDQLNFLGSVASAVGLFGGTKSFVFAASPCSLTSDFPEHPACQGAGRSRRGFLTWRLLSWIISGRAALTLPPVFSRPLPKQV